MHNSFSADSRWRMVAWEPVTHVALTPVPTEWMKGKGKGQLIPGARKARKALLPSPSRGVSRQCKLPSPSEGYWNIGIVVHSLHARRLNLNLNLNLILCRSPSRDICAEGLSSSTPTPDQNLNEGLFTWHRGDFRAGVSSLRFPLMALHLFTWYKKKMSCQRESPRREFTPVVAPERESHSVTKSRNGIM